MIFWQSRRGSIVLFILSQLSHEAIVSRPRSSKTCSLPAAAGGSFWADCSDVRAIVAGHNGKLKPPPNRTLAGGDPRSPSH